MSTVVGAAEAVNVAQFKSERSQHRRRDLRKNLEGEFLVEPNRRNRKEIKAIYAGMNQAYEELQVYLNNFAASYGDNRTVEREAARKENANYIGAVYTQNKDAIAAVQKWLTATSKKGHAPTGSLSVEPTEVYVPDFQDGFADEDNDDGTARDLETPDPPFDGFGGQPGTSAVARKADELKQKLAEYVYDCRELADLFDRIKLMIEERGTAAASSADWRRSRSCTHPSGTRPRSWCWPSRGKTRHRSTSLRVSSRWQKTSSPTTSTTTWTRGWGTCRRLRSQSRHTPVPT
jgi:hypothetical protein